MTVETALVIAVLVLSVLCSILLYVCIRVINELLWVREDLQQASDTEHAKCIGAVAAYVGDEWAAQVLDVAAADYASAQSHGGLDRITRLMYKPGGPPIPAIWLRERADQIRTMAEDVPA